jgi:DNA repair protein RadC
MGLLHSPELPRERCLIHGPRTLSLRECVALVLGTVTLPEDPAEDAAEGSGRLPGGLRLASRLLERPGAGLSEAETQRAFFQAMEISGEAHLAGIPGLGSAGRARLLAAFELGRRYAVHREARLGGRSRAPGALRASVIDRAAARIPAQKRLEAREWLGFVPLHAGQRLGDYCEVERGVRTHVNTDPVELFARVLALRPVAFFLFHNHPSGDPRPSEPDRELTRRVADLGSRLGVRLAGHAIVTSREEHWIVV